VICEGTLSGDRFEEFREEDWERREEELEAAFEEKGGQTCRDKRGDENFEEGREGFEEGEVGDDDD